MYVTFIKRKRLLEVGPPDDETQDYRNGDADNCLKDASDLSLQGLGLRHGSFATERTKFAVNDFSAFITIVAHLFFFTLQTMSSPCTFAS